MEGKEVVIYKGSTGAWINGLLLGALVGAVAALLYTPQSGNDTRRVISDKSSELRDRAVEIVDDTRGRAKDTFKKVRSQLQQTVDRTTHELAEENQIMEDRMRRTYDL